MSSSALSSNRLARLHSVMAGYVDAGVAPGIVTLVHRRGETYVDTIGHVSTDHVVEVRRDTIFRVSSMTKPIVAVAAMMLVEEGILRLDDPVDELLPELAERRVLREPGSPIHDTVPSDRSLTLRDLLTFRMGLGVLVDPPGTYPIQEPLSDSRLAVGPPAPAAFAPPDEWLRILGGLPLMHQPGERWIYSTGSDVLGVLVARASGRDLETFLRQRLFEPLGMHDTAFSVPADKLDRLPTSYAVSFETGELSVYDEPRDGQWSRPPAFQSGAGGLVSTIDDYLAFALMMLNKGQAGKERILARPTVELMTTNQLTSEQMQTAGPILDPGFGWGFGIAVEVHRTNIASSPGRFGWDGGLGTSWYSDPSEDLVGILMTQSMATFATTALRDFWTLVYQSIDD